MPEPIHNQTVHPALFGARIAVELTIYSSYITTIDLTLHGQPYTFSATRWCGQGFLGFQKRFHAHCPRDEHIFGPFLLDAEGAPRSTKTLAHKLAIVVQACEDVLSCVHKICVVQGRGILDYAVWYRERHPQEGTYSEFITRLACHFIVHTNFLAPGVAYELVQF